MVDPDNILPPCVDLGCVLNLDSSIPVGAHGTRVICALTMTSGQIQKPDMVRENIFLNDEFPAKPEKTTHLVGETFVLLCLAT